MARAIFPCYPAGAAFSAVVLANAQHSRRIDKRHAAHSTIWVFCPSVHSQEVFYESLLNWQPDAPFLPEAELSGIENVLPDPEITAERLALFLQIERDTWATHHRSHARKSRSSCTETRKP